MPDRTDGETGYAHADYAESLREFGAPWALPASGGYLLQRSIGDSEQSDLMGCYPIFSCASWPGMGEDLAAIDAAQGPVSVSMVLDPFGDYDAAQLEQWFPDLCRPFKRHYVVELTDDVESAISSHHRRNARKALKNLTVDVVAQPQDQLDDWHGLYANLIARHEITGISAFSRNSFATQLATPGLTMFRARKGDELVGMVLWYSQGDVAFYHLAAYTDLGYQMKASFAIFWTAIQHFRSRIAWLSLGAAAGLTDDVEDGLSRFKKGWSTDTRIAHICGRIFRPDVYDKLSSARGAVDTSFFPAYRAPTD